MAQGCAVGVQAASLQRVGHAEPIEHAAEAVKTEAPEGTFAVPVHQLLESTQLVGSSRVHLQVAAFPARPGVRGHPEQLGCFRLRERAECAAQVDQVQLRAVGGGRALRHV